MHIEHARQWVRSHLPSSEAVDLFVGTGTIFNDVHRHYLLREIDMFTEAWPQSARDLMWPLLWAMIMQPPQDIIIEVGDDLA